MKNLFHPFLFSLAVFGFVSCSKSIDDLPATQVEKQQEASTAKMAQSSAADEPPLGGGAVIFPMLYEPSLIKLAQPEGSEIHGEGIAVFFVRVDEEIMNQEIENAQLTITLEATGQEMGYYTLYPDSEVSSYNVVVPDDLQDRRFMFARIDLRELRDYSKNSFALSSLIATNVTNARDEMPNAFTYISE